MNYNYSKSFVWNNNKKPRMFLLVHNTFPRLNLLYNYKHTESCHLDGPFIPLTFFVVRLAVLLPLVVRVRLNICPFGQPAATAA